jgi:hypothetical protein
VGSFPGLGSWPGVCWAEVSGSAPAGHWASSPCCMSCDGGPRSGSLSFKGAGLRVRSFRVHGTWSCSERCSSLGVSTFACAGGLQTSGISPFWNESVMTTNAPGATTHSISEATWEQSVRKRRCVSAESCGSSLTELGNEAGVGAAAGLEVQGASKMPMIAAEVFQFGSFDFCVEVCKPRGYCPFGTNL